MKTIHEWFEEYSADHRNEKNKKIHFICVPLIFFSAIGLLSGIPSISLYKLFPELLLPFAHFGTFLIIFSLLFYVRFSVPITIGMLIYSVLCLLIVHLINLINIAPAWFVSLFVFVIAWSGQLYGHKAEGKKPAFLKDFQYLLIGPAWILSFLYSKWGVKF